MAYHPLTAGMIVHGEIADAKIDLAVELQAQARARGLDLCVKPRFDLGEVTDSDGTRRPYLNAWAGARDPD